MAIQTINPATNVSMKSFKEMTGKEVEASVAKAQLAFVEWKKTTYQQRAVLLHKVATLMRVKTMMEDKSMMTKMMKDDPEMKKRMTSGMMETAKADTSMMSQMCKSMMNNPEMMEMMQKMKEKNTGKLN